MDWPAPGTYRIDSTASEVVVSTFKEPGLAAKFAHDLDLATNEVSGTVEVGEQEALVSACVLLWNLKAVAGTLSRLEWADCRRRMRKNVLKKERVAQARFQGTLTRTDEHGAASGTLSLLGSPAHPVNFDVHVTSLERGYVVEVAHELLQTDYGIKPYKAMGGLLRLQNRLVVHARCHLS